MRFASRPAQPFRTKRSSIAQNCGKIAMSGFPCNPFARNEVRSPKLRYNRNSSRKGEGEGKEGKERKEGKDGREGREGRKGEAGREGRGVLKPPPSSGTSRGNGQGEDKLGKRRGKRGGREGRKVGRRRGETGGMEGRNG